MKPASFACWLRSAFPISTWHFQSWTPQTNLQTLDSVAVRVLEAFGFQPEFVDEEEKARREVETLARRGRWPVLLTPLDTSGEKPYEEFVGYGETEVDVGLGAIAALRHRPTRARDNGLFERLATLVSIQMRQSERPISSN